jgi:hypothetical protein
MDTPIDYKAVLKDLLLKRAELDAAIRAIQPMAGEAVSSNGSSAHAASVNSDAALRSDSFFGMGIGDAAVKYLGIVKAPKNIAQIQAALEQGGLTHTSQNFYGTVFTALKRRVENEGDITKVKRGEWGLTAWYPGLRKGKRLLDMTDTSESAEKA